MELAQDPNELFDIVTEEGEPTGVTKARGRVHQDGDWHRAVHVWFYGIDADGPFLLLNQRGKFKDSWPLALDATVGGHLGAGETVEDAFREVHEEIGVHIDAARFEFIFRRKRSSEGHVAGMLDRELQDVYLVRDDRPLTAYAPNAGELEGLVKVRVEQAGKLFRGEVPATNGKVLDARTETVKPLELTPEQLLVRGTDMYFIDVISEVEKRVSF